MNPPTDTFETLEARLTDWYCDRRIGFGGLFTPSSQLVLRDVARLEFASLVPADRRISETTLCRALAKTPTGIEVVIRKTPDPFDVPLYDVYRANAFSCSLLAQHPDLALATPAWNPGTRLPVPALLVRVVRSLTRQLGVSDSGVLCTEPEVYEHRTPSALQVTVTYAEVSPAADQLALLRAEQKALEEELAKTLNI